MNTAKDKRGFVTLQNQLLCEKKAVILQRISKIIKEIETNI